MRNRSLARILLAVLLLIALTAVGCGKKDTASDVQPPANQASDTVQGEQESEPPAAEEEGTAPEQTPEQPEADTPDADVKPFSYTEVADVFYYTEASLTDTFGKPQKISNEVDSGQEAIEYDYGDMEFKLAAFDESAPSVYEAELDNDKIPAPRGIAIGDSLDDVIAKFPQTSNETITEGDDTYKMLYGTFEYMGTFGYIEYDDNGQAEKFLFAHESVGMEIELDHDKVVGYRYFVSTN